MAEEWLASRMLQWQSELQLLQGREQQQRLGHSIFIFVGSEKTLADTEKQLPSPLLRVWPSDFWLQ
jgi:hypothetical protein